MSGLKDGLVVPTGDVPVSSAAALGPGPSVYGRSTDARRLAERSDPAEQIDDMLCRCHAESVATVATLFKVICRDSRLRQAARNPRYLRHVSVRLAR